MEKIYDEKNSPCGYLRGNSIYCKYNNHMGFVYGNAIYYNNGQVAGYIKNGIVYNGFGYPVGFCKNYRVYDMNRNYLGRVHSTFTSLVAAAGLLLLIGGLTAGSSYFW